MISFKKVTATILASTMLLSSFTVNAASDTQYMENISISSRLETFIKESDESKLAELVSMLDAKSNDIAAKFTEITYVDGVATLTDAKTEEATASDAEPEKPAVKYAQFVDRAVATVDSGNRLNIRRIASEEGEIVGHLASGGICLVGETKAGWTFVQSGNCEGYVKTEYLAFGDDAGKWCEANNVSLKAKIVADNLRVRSEADINSEVLTLVPSGESYDILGEKGEWSYISVDGDIKGYVKTEYLEVKYSTPRATTVAEETAAEEAKKKREEEAAAKEAAKTEATTEAATEKATTAPDETQNNNEPATEKATEAATEATTAAPATEAPTTEAPATTGGNVALGQQVASYALQFVGNPYVYGGTSLTNGCDCSGFTMSVYAHFGYKLPHASSSQPSAGYEVSMSALQPGDLIYYLNSSGRIGHVALYTGNGMVVHASSPSAGIKTSVYNYRTPYKAVRIIK